MVYIKSLLVCTVINYSKIFHNSIWVFLKFTLKQKIDCTFWFRSRDQQPLRICLIQ